MLTGSLPPTSNFGTWTEMIEYIDSETSTPIDFSLCEEIRLEVLDDWNEAPLMVLTLTGGGITTPSPGIIWWRVPVGTMGGFNPGTYGVKITAEEDNDTIPLMKGTVTIVG